MIRADVVHRLRGRLRLRADGLCRQSTLLDRIKQDLLAFPGVLGVRGSEIAGSLLIEYDPAALSETVLLRHLTDRHDLVADAVNSETIDANDGLGAGGEGGGKSPRLARAIQTPFERANETLFDLTDGYLDLRYTLPVIFVVMGTWKVLSASSLPSIPWYTYYWMSFRLFTIFRGLEKNTGGSRNRSAPVASTGSPASG
jgi:hypothetical protein